MLPVAGLGIPPDLTWIRAAHSLFPKHIVFPHIGHQCHFLILKSMIHVMIGTPHLNVAKPRVGQGVPIPSSLGLGGWLLDVIGIANQNVGHVEHSK